MISVLMPAYNTAPLIERAVRSVLHQSCQDFEILIVDDASTDNTPEVVRSIGDARIRIFEQEKNRGPAAARNRAMREARGEFCAYLDGDDYWEPEFLRKTSEFLTRHPEAVAVSVMQCHKIPGKAPECMPVDTGIGEPCLLDDFFAFWAKHNHVCTGAVLMRTEVARKLGGQREDLRICEDLEFWMLLATQGRWGFLPEVLFTSDGGTVTRAQGWLEKNRRRWLSAPTVNDWASRLQAQFHGKAPGSFALVLGRIARNLCYSHIMAGRCALAREEVLTYGRWFPANKINSIFRAAAICTPVWFGFCRFLKHREYSRKL